MRCVRWFAQKVKETERPIQNPNAPATLTVGHRVWQACSGYFCFCLVAVSEQQGGRGNQPWDSGDGWPGQFDQTRGLWKLYFFLVRLAGEWHSRVRPWSGCGMREFGWHRLWKRHYLRPQNVLMTWRLPGSGWQRAKESNTYLSHILCELIKCAYASLLGNPVFSLICPKALHDPYGWN